jgi:hypothetical protein
MAPAHDVSGGSKLEAAVPGTRRGRRTPRVGAAGPGTAAPGGHGERGDRRWGAGGSRNGTEHPGNALREIGVAVRPPSPPRRACARRKALRRQRRTAGHRPRARRRRPPPRYGRRRSPASRRARRDGEGCDERSSVKYAPVAGGLASPGDGRSDRRPVPSGGRRRRMPEDGRSAIIPTRPNSRAVRPPDERKETSRPVRQRPPTRSGPAAPRDDDASLRRGWIAARDDRVAGARTRFAVAAHGRRPPVAAARRWTCPRRRAMVRTARRRPRRGGRLFRKYFVLILVLCRGAAGPLSVALVLVPRDAAPLHALQHEKRWLPSASSSTSCRQAQLKGAAAARRRGAERRRRFLALEGGTTSPTSPDRRGWLRVAGRASDGRVGRLRRDSRDRPSADRRAPVRARHVEEPSLTCRSPCAPAATPARSPSPT